VKPVARDFATMRCNMVVLLTHRSKRVGKLLLTVGRHDYERSVGSVASAKEPD
jgi:hypothetical protein